MFGFVGFPVQTGRVALTRHVSWAETACEQVNFPRFSFYPHKEVHVQITTNHWNISRNNYVHDATVSWVETVNHENFKVNCFVVVVVVYLKSTKSVYWLFINC